MTTSDTPTAARRTTDGATPAPQATPTPVTKPTDAAAQPPVLSAARRTLGSRTAALDAGGDRTLRSLAAARVLVVGAGGLGAPVVAYLAGSGIGRLTIVDPDTVDPSNLARQTLFTTADVGSPKAEVAAAHARAVDPEADVEALVRRFDAAMVAGHDVVVDAADSVVVTRAVSDACAAVGVPFVWGTVLGYDGQVAVFDDAGTVTGTAVDFHDLHPDVHPDEGSCALDGVLPALCGAVGSVMAAQVTAVVAGLGEPLVGRVLTVDARRWHWTESPLRRGPESRRPVVPTAVEPERIAPAALAARLADPADPVVVVDVRTPEERATGIIVGAVTPDGLTSGPTATDDPLVVVCARGPRAVAWAASSGRPSVVLDGGMQAWLGEGRPVI